MRAFAVFSLILGLIMLEDCAAKRPVGIDMIIDGALCHATIRLPGCTDVSVSPPLGCKRAVIRYDKNCEQIVKGDKSK